jgi:hypothetical protein
MPNFESAGFKTYHYRLSRRASVCAFSAGDEVVLTVAARLYPPVIAAPAIAKTARMT